MALFGGVQIPGRPDLANVAILDRLPIPMIRKAQRLGFAIEREHFWELSSKFAKEIQSLETEIASYIPTDRLNEFSDRAGEMEAAEGDAEFNPASAVQIGKLLFDILDIASDSDIELKKTKAGGRISTGKKQLETLRLTHPVVPKILRHRELKKLKTTYADSIPKLARLHPRGDCCPICELKHDQDQWRVHGEMGTTRAETGRINHKNPNLGNIPNRSADGRAIQAGFIAPEGHKLVSRDLSQIELRCLAHLAQDPTMIEVYANHGDIHDTTAREIFNLPPDVKPDKGLHRVPSKRCNFSIVNGTTEVGLCMQIVMDYGANKMSVPDWLTEEWCKEFIVKWLNVYNQVPPFFDRSWFRARAYGLAWDIFGRVRLIPEVKSYHSWIRQAGLRQAQNMPVTSTAAGQLKLVMGRLEWILERLREQGVWCHSLLTIHDCVKVEAAEEDADVVMEAMQWAFDGCMDDMETNERQFLVPIESDGDITGRWQKEE